MRQEINKQTSPPKLMSILDYEMARRTTFVYVREDGTKVDLQDMSFEELENMYLKLSRGERL